MILRFQAPPQPTIPSGPLRGGAGLPRCHVAIPLHVGGVRCGRRRMGVRASMRSGEEPERWDGEFLQASLLVPETVRHYNLLRQGFLEETKWHSSGQMDPHCAKQKGPSSNANSVGYEILDSFHNPTIFLKIACDCDLLLPIVVGESAMERFLESLTNNRKEGHPSQLQFIQKLVEVLGHEVKMVQITKRVVTTYYADIILGKPAEMAYVSVDSRPSDAVCVANMFKDKFTGKTIGRWCEEHGVYYLSHTAFAASATQGLASARSPLQWHHRLGHLSIHRFKRVPLHIPSTTALI